MWGNVGGDVSGQRGQCHQPTVLPMHYTPTTCQRPVGEWGSSWEFWSGGPGRYHLAELGQGQHHTICHGDGMHTLVWWDEKVPHLCGVLPKIHPLIITRGKTLDKLELGTFYKIPGWNSSKLSRSWKKQGRTKLLQTSRDLGFKTSKCNCSFLVQFLGQKGH